MIVYNRGEAPIVIVAKWSPSLFGGPAQEEISYMIEPGQGIDLKILKLFTQDELLEEK